MRTRKGIRRSVLELVSGVAILLFKLFLTKHSRRDGSPFMNLLMVAPLMDSRGKIRYFIGAQVDVTGLCKDCTDLEGLRRLVEKKRKTAENSEKANDGDSAEKPLSSANEFQELSEMFNETEIEAVRRHGGRMNAKKMDKEDSIIHHRPRLHVRDPSTEEKAKDETPSHYPSPSRGRLLHVYQNVSFHFSQTSFGNKELTRLSIVSPCAPCSISPHSIRFASASHSRYITVTIPVSHRRLLSRTRRAHGRPIRRPWCHCQDPLGQRPQRRRGRTFSLGALHSTVRSQRLHRCLDGSNCRRGRLCTHEAI